MQQWISQLDFSFLWDALLMAAASLLCITVHETCHGLSAYWLGDDTAKRAGRLSLNPLRHLDPVGLIAMVLVHFGWAKPVPINPGKFRHLRRDTALTALAGPVSNVLLAWVALCLRNFVIGVEIYGKYFALLDYFRLFLEYTAILSAGLAVFNIFPIPPLDGSKVLFSFLPDQAYRWILRYERYGFLLMVVLIWAGVLDAPLIFLRTRLLNLLSAVSAWPYSLMENLSHLL